MNLAGVRKRHSRTKRSDKPFLSRVITLKKFLKKSLGNWEVLRLTKTPFNTAVVTASFYLRVPCLLF